MSNASSEPASNAIERLREAAHAADGEWDGYDGSGVHGYDPESTCPVCVAVAAVDALYQAAKELDEVTRYRPGGRALHVALLRVEGEA